MIKLKNIKENAFDNYYEDSTNDTMNNKTVFELLNEQVVNELQNMLVYKNIACACNSLHLRGFTKYFDISANEEYEHSNKIINILQEVYDGYIIPKSINVDINLINMTLQELVNYAYALECETTRKLTYIKNVCEKSNTEGHTYTFICEMLEEQIEEEGKLKNLLDELEIAKDDPSAILMLDLHYLNK